MEMIIKIILFRQTLWVGETERDLLFLIEITYEKNIDFLFPLTLKRSTVRWNNSPDKLKWSFSY